MVYTIGNYSNATEISNIKADTHNDLSIKQRIQRVVYIFLNITEYREKLDAIQQTKLFELNDLLEMNKNNDNIQLTNEQLAKLQSLEEAYHAISYDLYEDYSPKYE